MLVIYGDENDYPYKLIAFITGESSNFDTYQLIVQEGERKKWRFSFILRLQVFSRFKKYWC